MVPGLKELSIGLGSSPFSKLIKSTEAQYWNQFFDVIVVATTRTWRSVGIDQLFSMNAGKVLVWQCLAFQISVIYPWKPSPSSGHFCAFLVKVTWRKSFIPGPHLKSLYLAVNIQQPFNQRASLLNHNLQYLSLETLVFIMESELVQCINQIFPHLKNCIFCYCSDLGTSLVQSAVNWIQLGIGKVHSMLQAEVFWLFQGESKCII